MDGEQAQVLERLGWVNERARSIDARLLGLRDDVQDLTHAIKCAMDADLMTARSRTEFGQILAGLKARGVITQADIDRLERDGMREAAHVG